MEPIILYKPIRSRSIYLNIQQSPWNSKNWAEAIFWNSLIFCLSCFVQLNRQHEDIFETETIFFELQIKVVNRKKLKYSCLSSLAASEKEWTSNKRRQRVRWRYKSLPINLMPHWNFEKEKRSALEPGLHDEFLAFKTASKIEMTLTWCY